MKKMFFGAVVVAAVFSFVAALCLSSAKQVVYSIEEIQYCEKYQSLGVLVYLSSDKVVEGGCHGFEIVEVDENGKVELFRSVECDYYRNSPHEGMVVTCYSSNGLTRVLEGEHSEKSLFWSVVLHRFIGIFADIINVLAIMLVALCLIVVIVLLKRKPNVFARRREIKRYCTPTGTKTDVYYVDGISKETVLSKVSVVETSDELDFKFDTTFSDMLPVDKVLDLSKNREDDPVEGNVVTVIKKGDDWMFVAGEFSLRKAIKKKRCSLYRDLAVNVLMFVALLFLLFV